jgi:hypothetical protein
LLLYRARRSDRASQLYDLTADWQNGCRHHTTADTAATTTTKECVAQVSHHSVFYLDESLMEEHVFGSLGLEERNNLTDPAQNFLLFGTLN